MSVVILSWGFHTAKIAFLCCCAKALYVHRIVPQWSIALLHEIIQCEILFKNEILQLWKTKYWKPRVFILNSPQSLFVSDQLFHFKWKLQGLPSSFHVCILHVSFTLVFTYAIQWKEPFIFMSQVPLFIIGLQNSFAIKRILLYKFSAKYSPLVSVSTPYQFVVIVSTWKPALIFKISLQIFNKMQNQKKWKYLPEVQWWKIVIREWWGNQDIRFQPLRIESLRKCH